MERELWFKEIKNPVSKPMDEWRDELYGYFMVVTDIHYLEGLKMATARFYGTDREKLLDIWSELCDTRETVDVEFVCNIKSSWMGGVFLDKIKS